MSIPPLCSTSHHFIATLFVFQIRQPFLRIPPEFSAPENRQLIMELRQTVIQL